MKLKIFLFRMTVVLLAVLILMPGLGLADQDDQPGLMKQYRAAVEDAKTAEPNEICRNLTAIVSYNESLVWREKNSIRQVLVVTWTWNQYDQQVGQTICAPKEIWVTAVPELKNFCQALKLKEDALNLRLEQLLGLPPGKGKTTMVEIWASPADLYRPSPDPEITDQETELDFPNSWFMTVTQPYVQWFDSLKATSYGENGYPWTRLGYTYDWGNPESEVGLSEFVIRSGASIEIQSATITGDYCQSHE